MPVAQGSHVIPRGWFGENTTRHGLQVSRDHCSSAEWLDREPDDNASVAAARTWLLRIGWRGA
jgi:hypothetical protein